MKLKEEYLPIRSGMFSTCPIVESDSVIKKTSVGHRLFRLALCGDEACKRKLRI